MNWARPRAWIGLGVGIIILQTIMEAIPEKWYSKDWFKITAIITVLSFIYIVKRLEKRYINKKYIKEISQ